MTFTFSLNGLKVARLLLVLSVGSLLSYAGARWHKANEFSARFEQFISAAIENSESNDPSERKAAREYANQAVAYLENHGMTSGSTGVFYHTPENDVGRWYNRVQELVVRLDNTLAAADQKTTEDGKVLIYKSDPPQEKPLRAILAKDNSIKSPSGISAYPYNKEFTLWWAGSAAGLVVSLGVIQVLRLSRKSA